MWMWQEPEYDKDDDYDPFATDEDAESEEDDDEETEEETDSVYTPDEVDVLYDADGDEIDQETEEQASSAEKAEDEIIALDILNDPLPDEDDSEEDTSRKKLKRELRAEALARLESAARSESDFQQIIDWWDRLDRNRERKERYHEVSRGDTPLEYNATYDGLVFPLHLNEPIRKQAQRGNFIEWMFDCPFEMDELVSPPFSRFIRNLSDDHKEILFFHYLHRYSTVELGAMRGQSDRNIRKVRKTMLKHLRRDFLRWLKRQFDLGREERLPKEYIRFMEKYDEG